MRELVTTGTWIVRPGEEEDFVRDWTEFAEWAATQPGAIALRLGRDVTDPSRFVSFAPWADAAAVRAWKSQPGFSERLARARAHTTAFETSELDVVASASAVTQMV
jgi:heme-degrading monooxygenase HmoA